MRFGSARFGEFQFGGESDEEQFTEWELALRRSIVPNDELSTRERFNRYVKSPFRPTNDTDFAILTKLVADAAAGWQDVRGDVLLSQYIDTASDLALDFIGDLVQVPRRSGELDEHYRPRLKAQLRRLIGNGDLNEVRETTALLLETDPSNLEISEPFDTESARIDLAIKEHILQEAAISADDLVEFASAYRAGGVELNILLAGSFGYRSLEDYQAGINNPDRAYNNAPYRGELN